MVREIQKDCHVSPLRNVKDSLFLNTLFIVQGWGFFSMDWFPLSYFSNHSSVKEIKKCYLFSVFPGMIITNVLQVSLRNWKDFSMAGDTFVESTRLTGLMVVFSESIIFITQWITLKGNFLLFIGRLFCDIENKENQLSIERESIFQNVIHPLGEKKRVR